MNTATFDFNFLCRSDIDRDNCEMVFDCFQDKGLQKAQIEETGYCKWKASFENGLEVRFNDASFAAAAELASKKSKYGLSSITDDDILNLLSDGFLVVKSKRFGWKEIVESFSTRVLRELRV
ncbi:hypothetical protein [Idiomarina piscisalsi]|uniref:Uncharacterized protein n=1 Tax=Idiomarina piscisalsi TaxID=1096243 RepID=A0A432YXF7_9GAMM|nr:hypothetical protein [Idiomarina piscisalsi]RUO68008.1 hypothetical protein CWI73_03890 [Idiomarina piscisalsi]